MDRRTHQRISLSTPAVIETRSEGNISGNVTELTVGGASLSVNREIPHDAAYLFLTQLSLRLPIQRIWCSKLQVGTFYYGFNFRHVTRSQYVALNKAIRQYQSATERRQGDRRTGVLGVDMSLRKSDRRREFLSYHCFVNGRFRPTENYLHFPKVEAILTDPETVRATLRQIRNGPPPISARSIIFGSCSQGGPTIFADAIDAAWHALPEMKRLSLSTRVQILRDIRRLILENQETIIQLFEFEGHPRRLAEWEFLGMTSGLSEETLEFYRTQMVVRPKGSNRVVLARKPDGIVGVSPPGNAPTSNSLTACLAFLGGNCLIIKPPRSQPISTIYLWKDLIYEALRMNGAPAGAVNIVIGHYQEVYDSWLNDKRVRDILYFGTSERGIELGRQGFEHNKKVILELSGKDPMVIWKDADIDNACISLRDGFLGSTQICMVPKIAFIHEDAYRPFSSRFVSLAKEVRPTLPSNSDGILSPVLKMQDFFRFLQDALDKGGKLLYGGERQNHRGEFAPRGQFIQPTVIEFSDDNPQLNNVLCISEENFFPIIPLVRITGTASSTEERDSQIFEKIISMVNRNEFGLRISAWANSPKFLRKFVRCADNSGLMLINQRHVGFSPYLATHGGINRTGGPYGELNYIWQKTTHLQGISLRGPA